MAEKKYLGSDGLIRLVANILAKFEGKADSAHTHTIASVANLQSSLDAKANASHEHAISDVSNLQDELDAINANAVAITNEEIDNICGASIVAASEVLF